MSWLLICTKAGFIYLFEVNSLASLLAQGFRISFHLENHGDNSRSFNMIYHLSCKCVCWARASITIAILCDLNYGAGHGRCGKRDARTVTKRWRAFTLLATRQFIFGCPADAGCVVEGSLSIGRRRGATDRRPSPPPPLSDRPSRPDARARPHRSVYTSL